MAPKVAAQPAKQSEQRENFAYDYLYAFCLKRLQSSQTLSQESVDKFAKEAAKIRVFDFMKSTALKTLREYGEKITATDDWDRMQKLASQLLDFKTASDDDERIFKNFLFKYFLSPTDTEIHDDRVIMVFLMVARLAELYIAENLVERAANLLVWAYDSVLVPKRYQPFYVSDWLIMHWHTKQAMILDEKRNCNIIRNKKLMNIPTDVVKEYLRNAPLPREDGQVMYDTFRKHTIIARPATNLRKYPAQKRQPARRRQPYKRKKSDPEKQPDKQGPQTVKMMASYCADRMEKKIGPGYSRLFLEKRKIKSFCNTEIGRTLLKFGKEIEKTKLYGLIWDAFRRELKKGLEAETFSDFVRDNVLNVSRLFTYDRIMAMLLLLSDTLIWLALHFKIPIVIVFYNRVYRLLPHKRLIKAAMTSLPSIVDGLIKKSSYDLLFNQSLIGFAQPDAKLVEPIERQEKPCVTDQMQMKDRLLSNQIPVRPFIDKYGTDAIVIARENAPPISTFDILYGFILKRCSVDLSTHPRLSKWTAETKANLAQNGAAILETIEEIVKKMERSIEYRRLQAGVNVRLGKTDKIEEKLHWFKRIIEVRIMPARSLVLFDRIFAAMLLASYLGNMWLSKDLNDVETAYKYFFSMLKALTNTARRDRIVNRGWNILIENKDKLLKDRTYDLAYDNRFYEGSGKKRAKELGLQYRPVRLNIEKLQIVDHEHQLVPQILCFNAEPESFTTEYNNLSKEAAEELIINLQNLNLGTTLDQSEAELMNTSQIQLPPEAMDTSGTRDTAEAQPANLEHETRNQDDDELEDDGTNAFLDALMETF